MISPTYLWLLFWKWLCAVVLAFTQLLRSARGQREDSEHYEEIGDYDYNNPGDTSNFCPGLQVRGQCCAYPHTPPGWREAVGNAGQWGHVRACPASGTRGLACLADHPLSWESRHCPVTPATWGGH